MISVDSYGWVERFSNGPKASRYNSIIDRHPVNQIVTSAVVLYEVYRKLKRAKGEETGLEAIAALSQTMVVPMDQTIALEAADYSLEHGLHMSDAIVYATARHYGAELYTSDEDLGKVRFVTFV